MKILLTFVIICLASGCSLPNCLECQNDICVKCKTPFQIYKGLCVGLSCISKKCSKCDLSQYWCIKCSSIYQLKLGQCRIASYIYAVSIISLIIMIGFCIFCCIWRKKIRKQCSDEQKNSNATKSIPTKLSLINNPQFQFQYLDQKSCCSICLQNKSNMITQCGHYFHAQCFSYWVQRNKRCPVCNNKDILQVIQILCMKCKKKYYIYQICQSFLSQIKVDSLQPCSKCCKPKPYLKPSLFKIISSSQVNLISSEQEKYIK